MNELKIIGIETETSSKRKNVASDMARLWKRFYNEGTSHNIPNKKSDKIYAIYENNPSGSPGKNKAIIGQEVSTLDHIPEGLTGKTFDKTAYLKFVTTEKIWEGSQKKGKKEVKKDAKEKFDIHFFIAAKPRKKTKPKSDKIDPDEITIRKAKKADAPYIAEYLLMAMGTIVYSFIGEEDHKKALDFMLHFVERENNQYSYENCFVAEKNGEVIAAINVYNGAKLKALRQPVLDHIKKEYGQDITKEDETQAGEYYIDTFGVSKDHRGQGIGTIMLQYLIDEYVGKNDKTLGLLVDEDNPKAKKLYEKMGFEVADKKELVGKKMEHLQRKDDDN